MAQRKISDTLRTLNTQYGGALNYQKLFMDIAAGNVPAERDDTGRFWLIDEADLPAIALFYGLRPAKKAKPTPTAKPKAAAKPRARSAA